MIDGVARSVTRMVEFTQASVLLLFFCTQSIFSDSLGRAVLATTRLFRFSA